MDFSFQIEGLDQIARSSGRVKQAVADEINKGVYASAQKVATEYKKSIVSGQKSGRIYRRGKSVTHRASAPGEAPASDTGRLVNAIHVLLDGAGSAIMHVATMYAMLLEFGTSKMAARPAAVPAMEKSKAWIRQRLGDAVRRGIEKAGK